jgi:proline racemase
MNQSQRHDWHWQPPAHWARITTIDMHAGGEPLRVITDGLPPINGSSVLEKRRYFREHYDYLRTGLMFEPRGHADMYGAVISASKDADFDVFFLHNEGYSTMCGHAILALTRLASESGHASDMTFSVPAGKIRARAVLNTDHSFCESTFNNVPSFLYLRDKDTIVPGLGCVRFDVAYGGAFYAMVEAAPLGIDLTAAHYSKMIDYGRRIKRAVTAQIPIEHPFEKDLSFLYGTIFTGPAHESGHHSRNVCIFADGEVDRSPTGSGVSARAALHYAKGELRLNEKITIESILGSTMTVQVVEQTNYGPYDAIVPEVSGTAYVTGRNEFWFDPNDPFSRGFIFR